MMVFDDVEFQPRTRCCIAAAIIGAGALTAGASVYGSSQQVGAANNATNANLGMFNQTRGMLQSFVDAGRSAIPNLQGLLDTNNPNSPLSALLRLVTPGASQTETLEKTPGFQFSNTYGQKAVSNALAARGIAGPGGALARGGADYAEGLAGTQYTNIVQALLSSLTGGGNMLQNLVNTGGNAAAGVGNAATTTGGQIGSNMIGAGNAQAGGAVGAANALGGGVSTAAILQKLTGGGGGGNGLYDTTNGMQPLFNEQAASTWGAYGA